MAQSLRNNLTIRTAAPIVFDKDQTKLFQITFFRKLWENDSLFSHLFWESLNYRCSCHTSTATFLSSFETPPRKATSPGMQQGKIFPFNYARTENGWQRFLSCSTAGLVGVRSLPFSRSRLSYSSAAVLTLDFAWQLFGAERIAERRGSTSAGLLPWDSAVFLLFLAPRLTWMTFSSSCLLSSFIKKEILYLIL